jgi:hypothetical protein
MSTTITNGTHEHTEPVTAPNGDEKNSSRILYRVAEYVPRRSWRTWLIGRHLATEDAPHQTIGKAVGLAVFASDALSSTAYATQEILAILAAAGPSAFGYAFPISIRRPSQPARRRFQP